MKKKEGETQALFQKNQPNQSRSYTLYQTHSNYPSSNHQSSSNYQPNYSSSNNQASSTQTYHPPNNHSNNPNNFQGPRPERPRWDPILVSYTELLPQLIQSQLLARTLLNPLIPPYLRWYDTNASCDYHYGTKGHSTES